jgi:MYXO-CTERM domain-containing protein
MLSVRQAPRMGMRALAACGVVISLSAQAHAHFKLDAPACYMSQDATGYPQKGAPCGPPDSNTVGTPKATMAVTAYQPGQMITIKVTPTVPHSGWWRVALHTGNSATQTTTTLPEASGPANSACNPPKLMNPVWSPTQPVIADGLLQSNTALTGQQTMQVKLPDGISCTPASPCTLQVMMIMTDHSQPSCDYHHCADITIGGAAVDAGAGKDAGKVDASSGAGGSGGAGAGGTTGGTAGAGGAGGSGTGGSGGSGGTTGGTTSSGGSGGSDVTSGAGGSSNAGGSSGSTTSNTTTSGSGGSATTSTTAGSGGSGTTAPSEDTGCSCSTPGRSSTKWAPVASLAALALMTGRRRRRRTARPS